jgi:uncharacterized protein
LTSGWHSGTLIAAEGNVSTYRIGVLADTHAPEFWPALPEEIPSVFQGVDLIFHLGDITDAEILRELSKIAPVIAIRGEHDRLPLPATTIVPIAGLRIGLIHGRRPIYRELSGRLAARLQSNHSPWWNGMLHDAVGSFRDVDAILFGHNHRPHMAWREGVFLFSPGAVFQRTREVALAEMAANPSLSRRLALRRWLARAGEADADAVNPPTVGILTIADGRISAEVRALSPLRTPSTRA